MLSLSFLTGSCEQGCYRKPRVCGDSESSDNWVKFIPPHLLPTVLSNEPHSHFSLNNILQLLEFTQQGLTHRIHKKNY